MCDRHKLDTNMSNVMKDTMIARQHTTHRYLQWHWHGINGRWKS